MAETIEEPESRLQLLVALLDRFESISLPTRLIRFLFFLSTAIGSLPKLLSSNYDAC